MKIVTGVKINQKYNEEHNLENKSKVLSPKVLSYFYPADISTNHQTINMMKQNLFCIVYYLYNNMYKTV